LINILDQKLSARAKPKLDKHWELNRVQQPTRNNNGLTTVEDISVVV